MSNTLKVFECRKCGAEYEYDGPMTFGSVNVAPIYCDPCERIERDRELSEMAAASRAKDRQERWESFCPPAFQKTDISLLPKKQYDEAMQWVVGPKGLLLHGITGKGKTRIAWKVIERLIFQGVEVIALTAGEFSRQSSDRAANGEAEKWAEKLFRVPVLFVDDLGKGKLTERNEADLFDIIDRRTSYERPMIITTNTVGDELKKNLAPDRGAPLIRRLREFCDCIAF